MGLWQGTAHSQGLIDPMQPPAAAVSPTTTAAGTPAQSGLQGVITSPGRKLALIDGQVVPLGEAVRQGTLSGLSDGTAVVRKNGERDVLLMHPDIDKRPARRSEAQ